MRQSTLDIRYEATEIADGHTSHGLLVSAYEAAQQVGLFDAIGRRVRIPMRTRDYTPLDKIKTLWASVVLGCQHTKQINHRLGAHEPGLAAVFGLTGRRFPDQSGVNTLLRRCTAATAAQMRAAAFDLLCRNTRATRRWLWLRLPGGRRVLVVDLDQRGLVVSGRHYELAAAGFFGRKRGRKGYQLSLAFLGGELREVLDEFLDPGATPAGTRVPDVLERLGEFCRRVGIAREDVVLRADAQFGTPAIIRHIAEAGFGYLIKGISQQHAASLERGVAAAAVFERAGAGDGPEARWVTDLGQVEHLGAPSPAGRPCIRARTIFGVWVHEAARRGPRPCAASRAKRRREGTDRRRVLTREYWLTSLGAEDLPACEAVTIYNGRQTIEAYFKDEQQALGARHVRTKVFGGAAVFQWLVAMTNNVLRWMQQQTFAGTDVEQLGLKRLTGEVMAIPAQLTRRGTQLIVTLDRRFPLVRRLVEQWKPLKQTGRTPDPPSPLFVSS
jgi:hypothetical protein